MNTRVGAQMSLSDRVWEKLGEAAIMLMVLSVIWIGVMTMLEPM